jgi:hypothetical protein
VADDHSGGHDGDGALIDELRRVVELVDPVPARVLDAARASFTWRTIDAELAELAYDSMLEASREALVRASGAGRVLTFDSPGVSVELEVTSVGSTRRLLGQLVPPQPAAIEIRHPAGMVTVDADALGRFSADGIPAGPVSLVCRLTDGAPPKTIATDWLVL